MYQLKQSQGSGGVVIRCRRKSPLSCLAIKSGALEAQTRYDADVPHAGDYACSGDESGQCLRACKATRTALSYNRFYVAASVNERGFFGALSSNALGS